VETADEIPCLIQVVFKDVPIKAVAHNSAIPAIPAKQSVQKLQKSRTAGKNFSLAWQISAIPAKAGIQYNKRALRAPFKGGVVRQSLQCARTALDLHWIPAFAGMAGGGAGMAELGFIRWMLAGFLHSLESKIQHPSARSRALSEIRTAAKDWIPAFAGMARRKCVPGYVLIRASLIWKGSEQWHVE